MAQTQRFLLGEWHTGEPHAPIGPGDGGAFRLHEAAWTPLSAKAAILNDPVLRASGRDIELVRTYREEFERCGGGADLDSHLRFMRRVNLAGLLQRLDTATMLESVEGRTPFADAHIAALAQSLPMREKYDTAATPPGKRCLREAFAAVLPPEVLARPKASFPLPFEAWIADNAGVLRTSTFAAEVFTPAAIETVMVRPAELWRLAWPMLNIAMWGESLWGSGGAVPEARPLPEPALTSVRA
jgi:asparagine synthase (glutamine-hydrolysing)